MTTEKAAIAALNDELSELEAEISVVRSATALEDALAILVEEAEEAEEAEET